MTTFLDVLPVDFKQTSDLLHSKIVERRFFSPGGGVAPGEAEVRGGGEGAAVDRDAISTITRGRMMMLSICSCRKNNQPNAIYPLGTLHRGLKKAHVMMLPSCPLWYYDDSFFFPLWLTWCTLSTSPFNHSQCPFIQMTDTDVTFLPNYNNMDLARLYVMILTSPPGLGVRWPSQSPPLIQELPVLESLPFQLSSCPWIQKLTPDITLVPNYNKLDLARSHASILTSPPPLSGLSLQTG
jgi:hypothetical protein